MKVETRPPSKGGRAEQSWQIAIDLFTIADSLGALVLPEFKGDEESLSVSQSWENGCNEDRKPISIDRFTMTQ